MSFVTHAIKTVRVAVVADACGISPRAVYKWLEKGSLPTTEFYGRTKYASIIEQLSDGEFSAKKLLDESRASKLKLNHLNQ